MKTAGFMVHYGLDGKAARAETHNEWLASLLGRDGAFMLPDSLSHVPAMKKHALAGFTDELEKIAGANLLKAVGSMTGLGATYGGLVGANHGAKKKTKADSEHFSERHPMLSGAARGALAGGAVTGGLTAGLLAKESPGRLTRELASKVRGPIAKAKGVLGLVKGDLAAKLPDKKRDEVVDKLLSRYKKAGVMSSIMGAAKSALTTPIPGTPELGGIVSKAGRIAQNAGPAAGKGPSAGFQKFVAQRAAAVH